MTQRPSDPVPCLIDTVDVECLFLHAKHVGRDARVVALETRHERHDDERRRRVARPEVAVVFLHACAVSG